MVAPARVVRLREWSRTSLEMGMDEVRALRLVGAGLRVLAGDGAGRYEIETSQTVGTIVTPTMQLYIEPKVPVARLLFLLGYLGKLPEFSPETGMADAQNLYSVMAEIYLLALEPALRHGLVQDYHDVDDAIPFPRGRIDWFAQTTRRFGLLPPVECRYSDLSVDTELNRRLLAATVRIARAGLGEASRRCTELVQRFSGVSLIEFPAQELRPLLATRRTTRFQSALVLAELILRNASIELLPGQVSCAGFLVDMNQLFERFVLGALEEAFDGSGWRFERHPPGWFLAVDGRLPMSPDGVAHGPAGTAVVIDVKYMVSMENADIYQMLAYCTAVHSRFGILIYAQVPEESFVIRSAGIEIRMFHLDLDCEAEAIKRRVASIVETIVGRALTP